MQALDIIRAEQKRRGEQEAAHLCHLSSSDFARLSSCLNDDILLRRARHCVTENERVLAAVPAMQAGNLSELGDLLAASHRSLKDDYEVTGIELDTLFEQAVQQPGCMGARMTGAGFGGCAIAIVKADAVPDFTKSVGEAYAKKIGYEAGFFACGIGDGAGELI